MKKKINPHYIFMRRMPATIVWGGLEKLMLEWFERIDYRGCRVTLVVSKGGGEIYSKYIRSRNLPIEVVDFPFQFNVFFLKRFCETLRLLCRLNPDKVVFCQGRFFCFDLAHVLAAFFAAKGDVYMHENLGVPPPSPKSSKKYFGFITGAGLWWYVERYLTRWRAYFCKKVFVVSSEIRDMVIDLWKYPAAKVEVLYHGVDVSRFAPSVRVKEVLRKEKGVGPNDIVIIAASRLSQEKCVDRSIEAFDILFLNNANMHLFIAGTGPYEGKLRTLAAGKTSSGRIHFMGHVSNVDDLYKMSDIYVLSSDNEGLSLAFLEALASGLVCVTTRCTGTTEVIRDGINGFLVDKSTQGILEGFQKCLGLSNEKRKEISDNAVRYVNERFEINRNVKSALDGLGIPSADKYLSGTE